MHIGFANKSYNILLNTLAAKAVAKAVMKNADNKLLSKMLQDHPEEISNGRVIAKTADI